MESIMSKPSFAIPDRMLAVMIKEFGSIPVVDHTHVSPPRSGQVLVKISAAPINPSDVAFMKGGYGNPKDFPLIPGFEGSGIVVAAGSGMYPRFLIGKSVACATNAAFGGTWAEYVLLPASSCVPLPKNVSLEQGATAIVNPMTALAFFEMARKEKHFAIVNTAASGALGRMILKVGLREKIPVIHIVRRQEQVDLIRSLGGHHVLNSTESNFVDDFRILANQLNATLILDAIGGELTAQLIKTSPFGSRLVSYGFLSAEAPKIDTRLLAKEDKRVTGFFLPNWMKRQHPLKNLLAIRKVRKLLATDLSTTVQKTFHLADIQLALDAIKEPRTAGKVLLTA
jgi:NADPH:quinone reductase-like Zn-dependent oxidoreductase